MAVAAGAPGRSWILIAAVSPNGDFDAHIGSGDASNRDGDVDRAGTGPDLRPELSGLPARVRTNRLQLLRVPLHVAASVQSVGIGSRRPMRGQSVLRERGPGAVGTAHLPASRLLPYSSSPTWPSTSDTRRSMRPASSMLWVAISIATWVALTNCISAWNT